MTAHLQIARGERQHEGRTGPKAAFEFYMAQHVPTTEQRRADIRSAGNSKAQFGAYCNLFGAQFGRVNGNGAVRSEEQREEVRENGAASDTESIVRKFAKLLGVPASTLAKVVDEAEDEIEDEPEAPKVLVATRISFPMAMAIKRAASKNGVTFEITDKTGTGHTADYAVKFGGKKLTPAKASAIIAESKSK